ncbi:MAG TPA: hypothetical protein VGH36_08905, partial [Acetobacteraceae bacterium]
YLQLDDVSFAYLCDEKFCDGCRRNGDDPEALPRVFAAAVNAALQGRPPGKRAVLGLVTTKQGTIEGDAEIKRRIEAAAAYVPLENICLSPQCGFSSTHHGNAVSESEQWRKLELVVRVARDVWGEA